MTGFIVIDKEQGISSAKAVSIVKKLTGIPCGHMGTLDPMASGVLPIAIGNAARLFDYFLNKRKTYIATFEFGTDSDTLDTTGKITKSDGYVPCTEEILSVIPELCGEVLQLPPAYSAKNINGKRGYQLAREGIEFELKPKKVDIYSIKLLKQINNKSYSFEIECGGGTYIRSIAHDMGIRLGTVAVMSALNRTRSGPFTLDKSVRTEILTVDNFRDYVIKTDSILDYDSIYANESEAKKLFNGLTVERNLPDGLYKIYTSQGLFYGLAQVTNCIVKVRTKLC